MKNNETEKPPPPAIKRIKTLKQIKQEEDGYKTLEDVKPAATRHKTYDDSIDKFKTLKVIFFDDLILKV
jgi:hypothetical protein